MTASDAERYPDDMDPRLELSLQAMLTEYTSLREESLGAITNRIAATNFTFAAISVLIAGLLTANVPPLLSAVLLVFFIPQLAKAGLLIWLGEYHRSQRAGRHIAQLEKRINALVGSDAVLWESGLLSTSTHMGYPYVAVVVVLLGSGYSAEVLGIVLAADYLDSRAWSTWGVLGVCVPVAISALLAEVQFRQFFLSRWRLARLSP